VNNGQQSTNVVGAEPDPAGLAGRVVWIGSRGGARVDEDSARFLEAHAMLTEVGRRLQVVPIRVRSPILAATSGLESLLARHDAGRGAILARQESAGSRFYIARGAQFWNCCASTAISRHQGRMHKGAQPSGHSAIQPEPARTTPKKSSTHKRRRRSRHVAELRS
jgi:hypothetical protein